jgi:hypothetical protein
MTVSRLARLARTALLAFVGAGLRGAVKAAHQ